MYKIFTIVFAGCLLAANNAFAALDFIGVTLNTADVETVMGLAIGGLVALWGFRTIRGRFVHYTGIGCN